mgnify:CR=1 FL=1
MKAAYSSAGIRAISVVLALQIADLGALLLGLGVGSGLLQKGAVPSLTSRSKLARLKTVGGLGAAIGAALGRAVSASKSMTVMAYR